MSSGKSHGTVDSDLGRIFLQPCFKLLMLQLPYLFLKAASYRLNGYGIEYPYATGYWVPDDYYQRIVVNFKLLTLL